VILHTGLGRAVLPKAALDAIASEQKGYSLLEVERDSGERSQREVHVVELVRRITGAESATVVNNNAGATLLALAAMAKDREVITSRGQLVEIGGSFRIPDVMKQSGASLVEVGTTNKTYLADYETAITERTALLMRVHTSNYRIVGFTHFPSLAELVDLGRKRGIAVMDDLGSGAFIDLAPYGVTDEPSVQSSVKTGADVITFSGDKLLGGPQAGLLVGKRDVIAKIRKHPLFRALRVDKLKLTALEATLKLYLDHDRLFKELPTLRMISMSLDECEKRALTLAAKLKGLPGLSLEILDDASEFGGGSVPTQQIPTKVVAIRHASMSLETLSSRLRAGSPSIFCRVQRERALLDVRTLQEGEDDEVAASLRAICG
jgi:L-seryl-tRNA(Ser) seleniumtransferase